LIEILKRFKFKDLKVSLNLKFMILITHSLKIKKLCYKKIIAERLVFLNKKASWVAQRERNHRLVHALMVVMKRQNYHFRGVRLKNLKNAHRLAQAIQIKQIM
jgi:hypothetical protein